MMRKSKLFTLLLAIVLSTSVFAQTNYYVSDNTGNDSNDGSSWSLAFKTIDKVLTVIGPGTNDGLVYNIYIAQGDYNIETNSVTRRFTGNKTIRFLGGYPVPDTDTPDEYICVQSPFLYPVSFNYHESNSAFRVGENGGQREDKSTDLYFSGINYRNSTLTGGLSDGTFLTVDATAKNSTVTMENMIISAYKSNGAAFIYYYQTEDCNFNADKIFVTGGVHGGVAGGSFFRAYGAIGKTNVNLTVEVTNSTFTGNSLKGSSGATGDLLRVGGALICIDGQNKDNNNKVIIENNRFCNNTTSGGDGVALQLCNLSKGTVKNNRFESNAGNNGIVYLKNVSFKNQGNIIPLSGNIWIDNTTAYGGAIYAEKMTDGFLIDGDQYSGNTATGHGGAMYVAMETNDVANSPFIIRNSTFCGNKATGGQGGAVYAVQLHLLKTENNLFSGNRAEGQGGGGIYLDRAGLESTKDQFYENYAKQGGGAISGYAGGSTVKANESLFENNQADTDVGGAIRAGDTVTSENCIYIGNTTGKGGGAVWSKTALTSIGDTYKNNTAVTLGGAVLVEGGASVFKKGKSLVVFEGNSASEGGAIYLNTTNSTLSNSVFYQNTASTNGGAIYLNTTNSTLSNSVFYQNHASTNGGAIYFNGTTSTFSGSEFYQNTASTNGGAMYINGSSNIYFKNSKSFGNSVNGDTTTPNSSEFWISKGLINYSTNFYIQEYSEVQLLINETYYPYK